MLEHDPYDEDTAGIFGSIAKAVGGAAKGVAKGVSGAAKGVGKGVSAAANVVSKVPVIGAGLKGIVSGTLGPYQTMIGVLSGERIDKAVLNTLKTQVSSAKAIAPYVQTVISFVPGVGQGISGGMSAALALAEGKPITEAVLAAARGALPGGPLAAAAFDAATAAVQGKGLSEIALAAVPLPPMQKDILRQSLAVAKDIAQGKRVDKILLDRANDNLSKLPASVQKAAQVGIALAQGQNIQKVALKAGASALGGTKVMNPFLKAASNLGASKAGIQKAVGAAQAIANGSPVLKKSLQAAVGGYTSGSPEHLGFSTAVNVLKKTAGNKIALGVARRALPNEAARKAFDSAIGVVSNTVSRNPSLAKRAGDTFVPNMARAVNKFSPYQPNLKAAIDSLTRNPTLASQHPMVLASKLGTSQQTVIDALKHVGTKRLLPWRSMSPNAARFIQKWQPLASMKALSHGSSDTAGLDETGTKYIVEKGDFPFKIAQKLTGNGNRWTELKALNTDKKPDITKNVWVGEVLNIPASWQKPTSKPSVTPAASSQPTPIRPTVSTATPAAISVAPGILQAKAILVAWGKTDGVNQAGVSDYGSTAADLSTDFGPRDSLQLQSFQNWANKSGTAKPALVVDGKLGPKSLAVLQSWAETRANQAVSSASPNVTTLPEILIEASAPVKSPGIPQVSQPIVSAPAPPVVSAPSPVVSAPALPAVSAPAPTTTTPPVSNTPTKSKTGPILAGAALGGTLFGVPGAIIGGIAGAAIA